MSDPVREETGGDVLVPVVVSLCDRCLDGEGGECHTPGCALWMNRAPDVAIRSKVEVAASATSSKDEEGGRCGEASPGSGALCCVREPGHEGVHVHDDGERLASWVEGRWLHEHRYGTPAPPVSQQGTGEREPDLTILGGGPAGRAAGRALKLTAHRDGSVTVKTFFEGWPDQPHVTLSVADQQRAASWLASAPSLQEGGEDV